jgi:hypothetical protein
MWHPAASLLFGIVVITRTSQMARGSSGQSGPSRPSPLRVKDDGDVEFRFNN